MFKYIGSNIPITHISFTIICIIMLIILYIGINVSTWKANSKKGKSYILKNIIVTTFLFIIFLGVSIFTIWLITSSGKEEVYIAKPTVNKIISPPIDDDDAKVEVGDHNHKHIISVKGDPKVGDKVKIKLRLSSTKYSAVYKDDKQKPIPKLGKHHYGVNEFVIKEIDTKLIKN